MENMGLPDRKRLRYRENDFVELWVEDGIIMEVFKPHVQKISLEMARQIVKDRLIVSDHITRPIFVDTGSALDMDKDCREYFASEESLRYLSASAFLIHNYMAYFVSKLFLAMNKPTLKTELFRSKVKALEWLQYYKNPV